jgi:hypothetical protein
MKLWKSREKVTPPVDPTPVLVTHITSTTKGGPANRSPTVPPDVSTNYGSHRVLVMDSCFFFITSSQRVDGEIDSDAESVMRQPPLGIDNDLNSNWLRGLVRPEELSRFLGISVKALHKLVREGKLHSVQVTARERRLCPALPYAFCTEATLGNLVL